MRANRVLVAKGWYWVSTDVNNREAVFQSPWAVQLLRTVLEREPPEWAEVYDFAVAADDGATECGEGPPRIVPSTRAAPVWHQPAFPREGSSHAVQARSIPRGQPPCGASLPLPQGQPPCGTSLHLP
jgi:hypothetical protein